MMPPYSILLQIAPVPPEYRFAALALLWTMVGLLVAILAWPRGAGRRVARQVRAVAKLGFREGIRMKLLWTVAFIAFIPGVLAYFSDADGTHAGRARLILSVCLACGEILGASIVVMLAALSVSREIESRVMHTLGAKPIPRWAILLGKALGFWAIDALFLAGLVLYTGVLVRMVPLRPESRAPNALVASGTWGDLCRNALVTRRMQSADGANPAEVRHKFIKPGHELSQDFTIPPEAVHEPLAVRFLLSSTWTFDPVVRGVVFKIGYEGQPPLLERTLTVPQDRPFEFFLPAEQVRQGGKLRVALGAGQLEKKSPSVITAVPGGVQLGFVADGFVMNLGKAFMLMLLQGWILSLIMTGWSGVLSFPVAVAMGLMLVLSGELSHHAAELLKKPAVAQSADAGAHGGGAQNLPDEVTSTIMNVLALLPDFRTGGGPSAFVDGTLVSAWAIAHAIFWMGLIRAVGWALPGMLLFQRREVGR